MHIEIVIMYGYICTLYAAQYTIHNAGAYTDTHDTHRIHFDLEATMNERTIERTTAKCEQDKFIERIVCTF